MSDIDERIQLVHDVDELDHTAYQPDPEVLRAVATGIGVQWSRASWGGARQVTKADVAAVLRAMGASPFTLEQHAGKIARMIRNDYSL